MTELSEDFRLDTIEVYPDQSLLMTESGERHVEPKVMAVLQHLAANAQSVVSRNELLENIWSGTVVTDEVVTRCVSELRTLLGDSSKSPRFIQTVPKKGYKLLIQPSAITTTTTSDDEPEAIVLTVPNRWRRWATVAAAVLLLGVGMYLGPKLLPNNVADTPATNESLASEPALAVLPFNSLEGGADAEYFGAGLAEELLNALVNVPGLRVASRSAAADANQLVDPVEIANALGVDAVLTGSVRRMDNKVRVTAQLINAQDGFHLWADQFEGDVSDVFRIQDDIAAAIVGALRLQLTEPVRVARISEDINALDYYLLGRHHWHKRTPQSLQRAVELFKRAVAADSTMAVAHSGLADAYLLLADYGDMPHAEAIALATPNVQDALELDPDLAEAHASLGMLKLAEGKADDAEAALREAVRLNPAYHMSLMWLGSAVALQGRVGDAHQYYQRAYRLDPLHPVIIQNVAMSFATIGDYKKSQLVIDKFDRRFDTNTQITALDLMLATETGDYQRVKELSDSISSSPNQKQQLLGLQARSLIHFRRGEYDQAELFLERARAIGELNYDFIVNLARQYARNGERRALESLLTTMTDNWGEKLQAQINALRGLLLITQEEYAKAAELLEQALRAKSRKKGQPQFDLLVISHLLSAYGHIDNNERFEYWRTQGLKLIEESQTLGFGHFNFVSETGYFYAAAGDLDAAASAFWHALTLGRIAPWELSEDTRTQDLLQADAMQAILAEAARTWPV